ncbi:MAG: (Fe-S)-binding protein [Nitrospinae bacterium]|nr:(Fe-S)-binding protein [Nitrospinota bacterium]
MEKFKYDFLESVRDEIDKCTKCASCQAGCPTYENSGSETLVARGKIRLAKGALSGETDITGRIANDFSQCLSCMNCLASCPSGVDTMKIFSAMRAEINRENGSGPIAGFIFKYLLPYPARLNILAKLVGFSSLFYKMAPRFMARFFPYSHGGVKRVTPDFLKTNLRALAAEINSPSAVKSTGPIKRVAFFSGCMTDLAFPETGLKVIEGLKRAGVEVVFPKEQVCCGAPAYYNGDLATTKALARKNIEVLNALNADAIVYSCATCGSVLGETYHQLFPGDKMVEELTAKVVDYQKLLIELSVESIIAPQNGAGRKIKVTYHDPCHLKRGMGVFREPRKLLKSLPNVEFVEMEGADRCCGGSGTFGLKFYGMSMDIGKFKVDAIKKSGADMVVTACPSCQLQLADSLHRFGSDIPVVHTADLVDVALARASAAPRNINTHSSNETNSAASVRG